MLECHVERMAHRRDVLRLLGLEIVQIFVCRIAGVNLVLDAVEARHHHGGEGEVGIRRRIREAYFDTTRLRVGNEGNANRGRTVACRVGEHHRRLEARHQALVAVGAGVGEGIECLGVLDDAADVVERDIGQTAVLVTGKQGLAVFLQRLVDVHARTIVTDQRLRHESRGLAIGVCDVVHGVLQNLYFVGLFDETTGTDADFALTAGRNFVVMHFDHEPEFLARTTHGVANVLVGIDRWHREIAALHARTVTFVTTLDVGVAVPRALHGVDFIGRTVHLVLPAHAVEDEELVLGTEHRAIGDARALQIRLGALADRTRVTLVTLHGGGLDDVATDVDRGLFKERVEDRSASLGHQDHVGLVDTLPSGDRGAVEHLAVAEQTFIHQLGGNGDVLLLTAGIGEAQVGPLHFLVLDHLDDVTGGAHVRSVLKSSKLRKKEKDARL